ARVVVADIDAGNAELAAAAIRETGGYAVGVGCDVGLAADVDRLTGTVLEAFGTVDVLVNNAAETGIVTHFLDSDEAWWDHFLTTNLKSQYLCTRRLAPVMARKGRGCVINVSSGGGTRAHRGFVAYDASKGGVEALTRALALELAPYGIRVNTLVPGLIATFAGESEESLRRRDETVPLGRGGKAEDLAGPAVFLASEDAAYVSGARLVVDGGVLAQQRSPQVDTYRPDQFPSLATLVANGS
ncbi:SDR family oxidoreductase, partial [Lentzea sp. PSKA42]